MSNTGRWALALLLFVSGVATLTAPLLAHHSFAATYLEADTIEIEGNVSQFEFKNPHSWIYVTGQEGFGPLKTYAAEWASTSRLDRDGIDKTTIHVGDNVRICPPTVIRTTTGSASSESSAGRWLEVGAGRGKTDSPKVPGSWALVRPFGTEIQDTCSVIATGPGDGLERAGRSATGQVN
jgi:hypothetical protein